MSGRGIRVPLVLVEGIRLSQLVDEFRELIDERDSEDAAVQRLTPSPYPDDSEAATAFQRSTRDEILDRRAADARTVGAALRPFAAEAESLSEADAFSERELRIDEDDLEAWLRTLTAIRLVIAGRLGITSEDIPDEAVSADGRLDVYDWLGYRLETLIQAADDLDEPAGR